jgi:hypothetical protein
MALELYFPIVSVIKAVAETNKEKKTIIVQRIFTLINNLNLTVTSKYIFFLVGYFI